MRCLVNAYGSIKGIGSCGSINAAGTNGVPADRFKVTSSGSIPAGYCAPLSPSTVYVIVFASPLSSPGDDWKTVSLINLDS